MASNQNMQEKIIKKAWQDAAFKNELLSNPKAAIEKELEISLPDDIEIKVVEETPKTFYVVLPMNPADAKDVGEAGSLEAQTASY